MHLTKEKMVQKQAQNGSLKLDNNGGNKQKKKKSNEVMARWEKMKERERVFHFILWPVTCRVINGAAWLHWLLVTWPLESKGKI